MSFQSANSDLQVTQEEVVRVQEVPVGEIPVFNAQRKMESSGILVANLASNEQSIVNSLIFG